MRSLIFGLLALACLGSCKTREVVVTRTLTETVTETVHDTTFVTEPDSSFYEAWIECRDGKPVLKGGTTKPGKNLNAPAVNLSDQGKLHVSCEARAQELFAQWKSTHKATVETIEVPIDKVLPLTQWQVLFIKLGQLFGVLLIAAIGYSLYKLYKYVKK